MDGPPVRSMRSIKRAAERGDPEAQYLLGCAYESGIGLAQSYEKAFVWYRTAYRSGSIDAAFALGKIYLSGHGVMRSPKAAAHLFDFASQNGNTEALTLLGTMFLDGTGVRRSPEMALNMFRKAYNKGDAGAALQLAHIYENGLYGILPSEGIAFHYYLEASAAGYPEAEYKVGSYYEEGSVVSRNWELAESFYRRSAASGYEPAVSALERICGRNTTEGPEGDADPVAGGGERMDPAAGNIPGITF